MSDLVLGALIGALAVVAGGIVAGGFDLLARRQDRTHDSAERAADRQCAAAARLEDRRFSWADRSAETLALVLEFATDVHPANATALIQNAQHALAKLERLEAKWESLRQPLGVLIVGLPSAQQRDLAEDVLERFRKIHNGLSWVLTDIARTGEHDAQTILALTTGWDEASARLRELREGVHRTESPGPT